MGYLYSKAIRLFSILCNSCLLKFLLSWCHILNFGPRLFLQISGSRPYLQQVLNKGLWANFQQYWNKVFSSLFEFGQCTSLSHILNFGPQCYLQIRSSLYYLKRLLIWWLKKVFSCLFDFEPRPLIKIKCSTPDLSSFVHILAFLQYVTYTYAKKAIYKVRV